MAKKRPDFSFPELERRGARAILRSAEEVQAEEELIKAREQAGQTPADQESSPSKATKPQVHKTTSSQVDKAINPLTGESVSREGGKSTKPLVVKYTTHLRPQTIKALKRLAFESERKDYEIVQEALELYLERAVK
jgi:hypothetical protein